MTVRRRVAVVGAAVAAMLGGGVAATASADTTRSARETIDSLQAQGYTVTVDRVGSGPLDSCTVTNVRNPNTTVQIYGRNRRGYDVFGTRPTLVSRTVQVSLVCGR